MAIFPVYHSAYAGYVIKANSNWKYGFFSFFFFLRIWELKEATVSVNVVKKVWFFFSNMADKILTTETSIL